MSPIDGFDDSKPSGKSQRPRPFVPPQRPPHPLDEVYPESESGEPPGQLPLVRDSGRD